MEIVIMTAIIVVLVMAARTMTNLFINYLRGSMKDKQLSEGQISWLRVGVAAMLYMMVAMLPPVYMGFTLKVAALINLGMQALSLDKAYFTKRTGLFSRLKSKTLKK